MGKKPTHRAALYVRVSTLEQAQAGYSVGEQEARLRAYAEARGWRVAAIYTDGGHSGATLDRPGLSALRAALGGVDVVLVYKLDRLSRSQRDTLVLIEDEFIPAGVDFVSVAESFDTSTPFGRAVLGMLSVFAQLEREQIKERMRMGKVGRAKSGKTTAWSRPPFGYVYEGGRLQPDALRAPLARGIIDAYLGGEAIAAICNRLNAEGHVGKPNQWHHKTVRELLRSPVYAGLVPSLGELYDGEHEALIDRDTWETVQRELVRRQEAAALQKNVARPFQSQYLLSGLLRCACGERMTIIQRNKRADGTRLKLYRCAGQIGQRSGIRHERTGCSAPSVLLDELEAAVLGQVEGLRVDPDSLTEFTPHSKSETELPIVEAELAALAGKLERLARLYVDGTIPWEALGTQRAELEAARASLEVRRRALEADVPEFSAADAREILAGALADVRELPHETTHAILRQLIESIEVHAGRLVIRWRFS